MQGAPKLNAISQSAKRPTFFLTHPVYILAYRLIGLFFFSL